MVIKLLLSIIKLSQPRLSVLRLGNFFYSGLNEDIPQFPTALITITNIDMELQARTSSVEFLLITLDVIHAYLIIFDI